MLYAPDVPKNWQQILDEAKMQEAVRRHRSKQRMNGREWFALFLIAGVFAAFFFALFWEASGRTQVF